MEKIDARGLLCPRPVILTKKLISEKNPDTILVIVDNEIATQNLSKLASQLGFKVEVTKEEKDYNVYFTKTGEVQSEETKMSNEGDEFIVVFSSDRLGVGDEDFSKKLLEGFVYSLSQKDKIPTHIICYNKGVRLTTVNKNTIEDLKSMEAKGTKILSCGLCLENYNVKDSLCVGSITNMDTIVDLMISKKTVKPC
ncbi:sulfurtransferase-like selenium metabolism protein YedF [Treponema phagedenis]|uniref:sulfurtransferase-like selenium metabolism protein YedF n=1 Tax=Treponema phagedenis TaxID=162 RepID=UPI0001F63F34|nr:sulfurtransferase-like selenium metabolism protein YedF [Treponema phagedenis]EFW37477.1 selenium metabolism protein YedF [Treponema phagedenis F0421]TYT78274.1 sulfurtransferase-like selenium metabolism protein YedF [Treponema phagedenis]